MDVLFNDPIYKKAVPSKFPVRLLYDFVKRTYSGGTPSKLSSQFWEGTMPWASPKDFSNEPWIDSTEDHISETGRDAAGLEVMPIDSLLIVVRSGVLQHTLPVAVSLRPMTINQDLKALILKEGLEPPFLAAWLKINEKAILRRICKHSTTVQSVNTKDLEQLLLPVPPIEKQKQLVALLEAARKKSRAKVAQADALLAGMDKYVLDTLGVTSARDISKPCFAITLSDCRSRLDADFNSPLFRSLRASIEKSGHKVMTVDEICDSIGSGYAAGKDDQAKGTQEGIPHLRPLNLNIYGELSLDGTKYVLKDEVAIEDLCVRNEVLFNNTNSAEMVGKTAVFDLAESCACSNHMTRLSLKVGVNPYFVAALFNSLRSLGLFGLLATNFNNQAGINTSTLSALRLPIPKKPKQDQIAKEVQRRRSGARRLRAEAEAGWAAAKGQFENGLLDQ